MSLAARNKPFRYAQAKPIKTQAYKLPTLSGPPAYSSGIASSDEFIATGYGSTKGSVIILPTDEKQYKPASTPFTVSAHASELGDLAFNPFVANQLATGAADGTVKLWNIPSGGLTANLSTPEAKFDGMDIVHSLAFHPSASGVLASGHKNGVSIFDLEAQAEKFAFKVEGFGKDITSVHWSRNGGLLAAVAKNAALSVFDPRSGAANVLSSAVPNTLIKKLQHGVFIGGDATQEYLLLFGVSSGQRPVMTWVDPRNPSAALKTHDFDFSQGYALPVYEHDSSTLYYTIRGSEMIALLDVEVESNKPPQVWPSHTFSANQPVKGLCLLPKRACTTGQNEIERVFTLGADAVEAYSVTVPRKLQGFSADLFPDTSSTVAAHSAASYASGKDEEPKKTSMVAIHEAGGSSTAAADAARAAGLAVAAGKLSVSSPTNAGSTVAASAASSSSTSNTLSPAHRGSVTSPAGRERGSSAAVYVPSNTRASIDNKLRKSVFTHCTGAEPPSQFQSYFDLKLGNTLALAENIAANETFFAVPWKASGGSAIAVFRLAKDAQGRAPPTQPCVRGHKSPASCFEFSPFDQHQLATGSVEGQVFLWRIPAGGVTSDMNDPEAIISCGGKVGMIKYHPYVAGILFVVVSGFDGHSVEVWNINGAKGAQEKPAKAFEGLHPEPLIDISVHPRSHQLATTCKDGKSRILSLSTGKVLHEWSPPESVKDTRILWVGNDRVLTCGFGGQGQRSMSLFEIPSSGAPKLLQTIELDRVSYLPLPRYDPDTKLVYLANAGGMLIPLFQISAAAPHIEQLNIFQTQSDAVGFVLLEKRLCDVSKVEIQRALKLTKDAVLPVTYSVPRKRLTFFQDDLYPPTRVAQPEMSAEDFLSGKYADGKDQTLTSLRPQGMEPLSEAPEEEMTEKQLKYAAKLAADSAPKAVGALGHTSAEEVKQHFLGLQANVAGGSRFDARVDNSRVDVDESEWD